jgi:hypothetical protein
VSQKVLKSIKQTTTKASRDLSGTLGVLCDLLDQCIVERLRRLCRSDLRKCIAGRWWSLLGTLSGF